MSIFIYGGDEPRIFRQRVNGKAGYVILLAEDDDDARLCFETTDDLRDWLDALTCEWESPLNGPESLPWYDDWIKQPKGRDPQRHDPAPMSGEIADELVTHLTTRHLLTETTARELIADHQHRGKAHPEVREAALAVAVRRGLRGLPAAPPPKTPTPPAEPDKEDPT